MVEIVQRDNIVLREKAKMVGQNYFGGLKLGKIIKQMKIALNSQDDGVAIAAPQIGQSLRIFVISKKVFEMVNEKRKSSAKSARKNDEFNLAPQFEDLVCINPKILKQSKEKSSMEEGCLSVRYLYGDVNRSVKATIEAYDEEGNRFVISGSGLLAQIFQHEIDHLDGVLFIDKAKNIKDIPPQNDKM